MAQKKLSSKNRNNEIVIKGARVNNLKNININIPRNKFVVVTGLSGSGKSSLAFDTIYAEGNRRYMEGLSSYARNFLDPSIKPDVDKIENLSPPISIDQKSISRSPRSTVGTLTEVYDYLRILFAKVGVIHCPSCGTSMQKRSKKEILDEILSFSHRTQVVFLAKPKEAASGREILKHIQQMGYARVRMNGKIITVSEATMLEDHEIGTEMEIVVDRIVLDKKVPDVERIIDSLETAMKLGGNTMKLVFDNNEERNYNQDFFCAKCGIKIKEITPTHFSFNSPEGACENCSGLGYTLKVNEELVIPNKNLSFAEGAIQPWSKSGGKINGQSSQFLALKEAAKKNRFSLNVPVKKLSDEHLRMVLYGSQDFEGVIPSLEKKYFETKSDYVRAEIEKYMTEHVCQQCQGKRLKKEFLSVEIQGKTIDDLVTMSISKLKDFFSRAEEWGQRQQEKSITRSVAREILGRLVALENVGLEYLNLGRSAQTISGGEAQRIRLASQLNSQLMGIVYVLDEPSIGLHSRDTEKLVNTIKALQKIGNSIIVVEHDESIIKSADWIIDMGPGAGEEGGTVVFDGEYKKLMASKNLTAQYLQKKKKVSEKNLSVGGQKKYRKGNGKCIEILGAEEHNLKNIDVKIPLGKFVVICGVSGSGKSTLMKNILSKALARHFYGSKDLPGKHKKIRGFENIKKVISINQAPIGRTPRSNAATYTGVFSHVRELFAQTQEAKNRGYTASRFSFNMKGGRCEVCQGEGFKKIEMHLLPDVYVKCEACGGTRFSKKTLEIEYKGYSIAQILDMDVKFALRFFSDHPLIAEKLRTMEDVGLGYLKLGQSATNLSGGEAQRIKLATELARKSAGDTLYILDEPTAGLHFDDIKKLLSVLNALIEKGNSVIVVEHNLDVVRDADWVIELGPDGGDVGGYVTFEGTPDKLKKDKKSWTGRYL
ncbi:MAG TPA: excinuclease ABC subunit UvrA [Candidatus Moranbacteria bacterium]|jgi:excinuclease ABC subunit A|nr:excinuclease ABC subunit UvrA [Candidatus Moranbacteria bacterium]HOF42381.1 excinuclease ABC subunit UvrA [Candidatus Moranbacteria bacterium]HPX94486.1 excinuclease ABC subunit UvrA [Candidatus Moranbacteria bacterium]HQB59754.1 excinuclease ABC subunit UvrA [Candidatus Moranbacteria bacterium]